ncbi:vitellin-degrading protease-like [Manduca sexta]|uniref:vitellin-degrading protease n=1 Tax=Manduca sexta TaxID=7130 RepID=UPI00188F43EF|nr:vitellin-degrading protease [Manduca sexta]XP_037301329.1 vitellin-degrading protease-like [Manduca sexta]
MDLVLHKDYEGGKWDNDVAIMRLAEPLTFSYVISAIGMAEVDEEIPNGGECIVTGWGKMSENATESSPTLRRVLVPKISQEDCAEVYNSHGYPITRTMVCAGYLEGGKDACQGDSGGPLVYNNKLSGIVSWGIGCAEPGFPGVYSNVATLREWIDTNINNLKTKHEKITV